MTHHFSEQEKIFLFLHQTKEERGRYQAPKKIQRDIFFSPVPLVDTLSTLVLENRTIPENKFRWGVEICLSKYTFYMQQIFLTILDEDEKTIMLPDKILFREGITASLSSDVRKYVKQGDELVIFSINRFVDFLSELVIKLNGKGDMLSKLMVVIVKLLHQGLIEIMIELDLPEGVELPEN